MVACPGVSWAVDMPGGRVTITGVHFCGEFWRNGTMFNPHAYENSRPGGISVLEVVNGKEPDEIQPRLFVPLKRTELQGEIIGPLASLRLTQTYSYTRQQCDHVLEAVYRFPLPGDAAVTS